MTGVMKDVEVVLAPTELQSIGNQHLRLAKVGFLFRRAIQLGVEGIQIVPVSDDGGAREQVQRGEVIAKEMGTNDEADFFAQVGFNPITKVLGVGAAPHGVNQQRLIV